MAPINWLHTKSREEVFLDLNGATDAQIETFLEDTDWMVDHALKHGNTVGVLHLMGDENIHNNAYPVITRNHTLVKVNPSTVHVERTP